jgi:hypothetical protein
MSTRERTSDAFVNALAWIAGILAASLPKRWWPPLDRHIPVTASAPLASILTVLVSGFGGISGLINHTTEQVSLNNRAVLAAAAKEAARPVSEEKLSDKDWGRMFVGVSSLSVFTFIFLTPAGWASSYFGLSGTWRAVAAAVDDPFGDPILTGVDALVLRGVRRARARGADRRRQALEGPEVPDRVVRGSHIGMPAADLVIVAARRKPAWDAGTVVDTGDRWYRVTSIEERTVGEWLRTLYALVPHQDHEAFRPRVRYDLPPCLQRRDGQARPDDPAETLGRG